MTDEYNMIDRFLRNNLDDDDYEVFSNALSEISHGAEQARAAMAGVKPMAEIGLDSNGDTVTQWNPDFNPSVGDKLYAAPVHPKAESNLRKVAQQALEEMDKGGMGKNIHTYIEAMHALRKELGQ